MGEKKDYLENEYVQFWVEDGVVHEFFKPGLKRITFPIAKVIVADRLRVSNHVTMPLLIYSNDVTQMDKEARDYFATKESTAYISASAMIIDNYLTLILSKLFISITNHNLKVELFRSKHKALEWLVQFKDL